MCVCEYSPSIDLQLSRDIFSVQCHEYTTCAVLDTLLRWYYIWIKVHHHLVYWLLKQSCGTTSIQTHHRTPTYV